MDAIRFWRGRTIWLGSRPAPRACPPSPGTCRWRTGRLFPYPSCAFSAPAHPLNARMSRSEPKTVFMCFPRLSRYHLMVVAALVSCLRSTFNPALPAGSGMPILPRSNPGGSPTGTLSVFGKRRKRDAPRLVRYGDGPRSVADGISSNSCFDTRRRTGRSSRTRNRRRPGLPSSGPRRRRAGLPRQVHPPQQKVSFGTNPRLSWQHTFNVRCGTPSAAQTSGM